MFDQKSLEEVMKAKQQIIGGKLTIWNERLRILQQAGKWERLVDHLNSSLDDINNCGCNVQCGAAADLGGINTR